MSPCGPGGCRPPGLAPPPPDPEGEVRERSTLGVVGATLLAVGGAMSVVGVLDAAGIVRLLGGSSLFLGLCGVLAGTLLVLVARSESTGDEEEDEAGAGTCTPGGVRRIVPDPEDFYDTEAPLGRVGGAGGVATASRRPPAPPASPAPAVRPPADAPPPVVPPFPGALPTARRRRR